MSYQTYHSYWITTTHEYERTNVKHFYSLSWLTLVKYISNLTIPFVKIKRLAMIIHFIY